MGNFSRDTFDQLKHYVGVRMQQGVPLVDADWNEQEDIRKHELRTFLKWFVGNCVPKGNDGFRIVPHSGGAENDFTIKGGNGTAEGAGRCLVEGWDALIVNDVKYSEQKLPSGADPLEQLLPPPSDERTDTVYLDVWEREVDAQEDGDLVNPAIGIETCVRLKREWAVRVAQGPAEPPAPPPGHVCYPLALLKRTANQNTIKQEDLTDLRRTGLAVLSEEITIKDGNVGIGTSEPKNRLEVNGDIVGNSPGPNMSLEGSGGENNSSLNFISRKTGSWWHLSHRGGNDNLEFHVRPHGTTSLLNHDASVPGQIPLTLTTSGNVGIGTTAPEAKLDVNGDINVTGGLSSRGGQVRRDFLTWNTSIESSDPIHIKTNIKKQTNIMYRFLVEGYNFKIGAALCSDVVGYTHHGWADIGQTQTNNYANGVSISQYYIVFFETALEKETAFGGNIE